MIHSILCYVPMSSWSVELLGHTKPTVFKLGLTTPQFSNQTDASGVWIRISWRRNLIEIFEWDNGQWEISLYRCLPSLSQPCSWQYIDLIRWGRFEEPVEFTAPSLIALRQHRVMSLQQLAIDTGGCMNAFHVGFDRWPSPRHSPSSQTAWSRGRWEPIIYWRRIYCCGNECISYRNVIAIHVYTHTHTRTHTYTYIHTYIHACLYIYYIGV